MGFSNTVDAAGQFLNMFNDLIEDIYSNRLNEAINTNSDLFIFLNIGGDLTMQRIKDRGLLAFQTRTFSH